MALDARLLVVIADLHAGSSVAAYPPTSISDGMSVGHGVIQEWLWEQWQRARAWLSDLTGSDAYSVVLNGDLIEGLHHGTAQVISPQVKYHVKAARKMLDPICKSAQRRWATIGTECHVRDDESDLGQQLGCEPDPRNPERFAAQEWRFPFCGCLYSAKHHISATTRKYLEASQLSIAMGNEQLGRARVRQPVPNVMSRAHRHVFGTYTDGFAVMTVSPPWQLKTTHGHKVATDSPEVVGMYAYDWRGKPDGAMPDVRTFLSVLEDAGG